MKKKRKEKRETQLSKAKRLKVKYLAHSFHKSNFKQISLKRKKKKKKKEAKHIYVRLGLCQRKGLKKKPKGRAS